MLDAILSSGLISSEQRKKIKKAFRDSEEIVSSISNRDSEFSFLEIRKINKL